MKSIKDNIVTLMWSWTQKSRFVGTEDTVRGNKSVIIGFGCILQVQGVFQWAVQLRKIECERLMGQFGYLCFCCYNHICSDIRKASRCVKHIS